MSGPRFHALRVHSVQADTADARVLRFEVPNKLQPLFAFDAGQYLTLRAQVDGQEQRRSYSICAAPGEPLRVGVRRVADGVFSTWLHQRLQAGDVIEVMPPQGRFGAALARRPRHLLAVAGGSGITPILSILKTALARDAGTRCTLVYANRSAASTMFREELDDLKNRHLMRLALHNIYSRELVDNPLQRGRLDAAKLDLLLHLSRPADQVYVCGPHEMNEAADAALRAAGVPAAAIHIERFGLPPGERAQRADTQLADLAQARVLMVRDGLSRAFDFQAGDQNILAAAARAGLEVPYSCRSGVCATCRCKLLQGEVRMLRNYALEPAEVAAGYVLSCQAQPLTAQVVLSFDER